MRFAWILCAAVLTFAAAPARASMVFVSTLNGASERPGPVDTGAVGSATAMLSGDAGGYVLSYSLNYAGLGSDAVAGHIHYSVSPPGRAPTEQTGPAVHPLDADFGTLGADGSISGQWRFDDAGDPLTDSLVDSLMDGELYFNIQSVNFGGGELRGQIVPLGSESESETDAGNGTAIPLPPALLAGLAGLGVAGWAGRRGRRPAA
jgi:hypothetical protein